MQENVAVVIARLAINAAILAIMKTGQKAPYANREYEVTLYHIF